MKKETIVEHILESPLNDLVSERYGDYAKYIIQERALPDARDGLKPVQRRILYAMYKDGNNNDKPFRKSAKTVGLVIGNYHPHGDYSVYEAMVRLSQSWKINHPLVQMHGNNGSIDDDPAAAMRYTEARLSAISETLLEDIGKDTVNWTPNFDDTENEPTVLPAKFPNLIVNGSTGIAAGYATNIPPHNLNEVIDGTVYLVNHPDCTLDELMEFVKGPDFPTGGIVQGLDAIKEAFTTGKGKVVVRSKVSIEKTKTIQQLVVTEIPYEVIKVNIVKRIDEIRFNKQIDGILDVRDESDRNGLRIVVDINKDADASLILNYLYKNTDLQVNYNYNMVAIVNNRPMLIGLKEALEDYVDFAKEVILRRSRYEFDRRNERCHVLEGLIKAVSVMDEIIKIIRSSKDKADAKKRLIEAFGFSEAQAEAIVILRLYRLTNTDVFALREEYTQLIEELKELRDIINNPAKLNKVLCEELTGIKNEFGHERLTKIEHEVEDIQIDKMSMIANERIMMTLSRDGYIKRVSLRSFNSSESDITGLKEGDELIGAVECDTLDTMLAFTESGEYVYLPMYVLNEAKWKDIGQHISKYVKVNNSEKFVSAFIIKDFNSYCWIVTASKDGMIKKSEMNLWKLQRYGKSSLAMNLEDGDKVIDSMVAYSGDEVLLVSSNGNAMRYSIDEIPSVSTRAKGVIGMRLAGDDKVVSMAILNKNNSETVFITSKGNSKRIKVDDVQVTRRATKGVSIAKKNKTNPFTLRYVLTGSLNEELNIICNNALYDMKFKDVGIMNAESRFSASGIKDIWYHYDGIKEIRIVDYPAEKRDEQFEELRLEV